MRVATAQLKATLEGHTNNVWSVAFSPDGQMLASGSWDETVRLWDVNTKQLLYTLIGHTNHVYSIVFSPDGKTFVSSDWDGNIRLWDPHTGKFKRALNEHHGSVASVVFSPDGTTLASGHGDHTIGLWNTTTWQLERMLTGHTTIVDTVAFSPDGQTLASGSRDKTIRLWDPHTGKHIKTFTLASEVKYLAFRSDGGTLASSSWDKTIRLWNPHTGQIKTTLPGQTGWVNPVVFSPDGATLAIGGRGISLWDTDTEQYKKPIARDIGDAVSVVFSPDGQMVASGSADKKVRLWNFTPFDYEIPSINTNGMVRVVYFLPNDRPARPDRVAALRQLIKDAQQFYAEQMAHHGFGRKTFTVETDVDGEPLVHQINGKFKEDYYFQTSSLWKVWAELLEHFAGNDFQHAYFIAIDLSSEDLDGGTAGGLASLVFQPSSGGFNLRGPEIITEREEVLGGLALIPSFGHNFERLGLTAHEIGHTFGLVHDFRNGPNSDYVLAGARQNRLSQCAAEWLSVSRFFNTKSIFRNDPGEIQLLSLRALSRDAISFRFKVTDPDGLHQAQLLVPEIWEGSAETAFQLFDCKRLNGKTGTVEAVVSRAELVDRIALQIIDVEGNITWATFPIQLAEAVPAQNTLDINNDGIVNLLDLTPFVSHFRQTGKDPPEVNGDGVVDIVDVLLVAGASSSVTRQAAETFTEAHVLKWLTNAKQLGVENAILQKGIVGLEHLLAEIALLSKPMEVVTGSLKAIFVGHTDHISSVAFSPDGQTLASSSGDKTIRLWDTHTAQHKMTLIGDTGIINSVAFSPDGQTLASASWDRTIRLWNPHTGKLKRTIYYTKSATSVAFSPDGQILASGGDDQIIRLWNTTTWQVERTLRGHTDLTEVVAFSRDGATLASGSRDGTIRLWNPHTGNHIRTLPATSPVNYLAFSPDGGTLASGSWDQTIRLWNPHTGKLKRTLPDQTGWMNPVAFSPDGTTLAIGNSGISLWDIETGQYEEPLIEDIGEAISVVFSPDGTMLASGSADKKVRLWELTPADTSSDKMNGDINGDGDVNILDLVLIASDLGNTGTNLATDVNGDGIINILDLILVAGMFEGAAAAPSTQPQTPETLTAVEVQGWLTYARSLEVSDPIMKRGVMVLEQLLVSLTPTETELLSNYPNPFNPETWIPYRLAEDAFVTLTIYDGGGQVVRTLDVGHRIASAYENRSKAIHWDGRNDVGESVASGIYFYTLTAGDYSATRRMVILK